MPETFDESLYGRKTGWQLENTTIRNSKGERVLKVLYKGRDTEYIVTVIPRRRKDFRQIAIRALKDQIGPDIRKTVKSKYD